MSKTAVEVSAERNPLPDDAHLTSAPDLFPLPTKAPEDVSNAVQTDALGLAEALRQIEEGETSLFEAAISAFHSGEFQRAESLFLEEAQRTVDATPQRAAIAFRQAALAARRAGNVDGSDHWMRLAGREYLRVSEDDRTPLPFIREAAVMAAKCFLSVENLHVASKGLRRAQAIESVLSADEDLMAGVVGVPFRHGPPAQINKISPDTSGIGPSPTTNAPTNHATGPSEVGRRLPRVRRTWRRRLTRNTS